MMRVSGPYLTFVAAALLAASTHAQDGSAPATTADMPYSSIIARNMFGLLPIPVHKPEDDLPPPEPPPKITPNGIMTIFGKDQALFKVAVKPKPGQPAKEDAHVLAEGEMEDEITVLKINHLDGIITFNNHGTVQELPLVIAKDTGGPPPGPGGPGGSPGGPGGPPGVFRPGVMPPPGANPFQRQVPRPMGAGAMNQGNPSQPNAGGNNFGNAGNTSPAGFSSGGQQSPQSIEDQVMSAARQMAEIEQNRIATQDLVDQGKMPPLPPTMLTPSDAHVGNSPLVVPSEPVPPTPGRKY